MPTTSCDVHKALAEVFRGKLLDAIRDEGLVVPEGTPKDWVVL
ncbi:hypothetical protein MNBD_GAMMA13-1405 [hydrothermal vent metagenome]|uniref:Uncharacterized protein n=1 Tax=hydrothermal vent metagenome TaxID=652676 RepID=A0A3B0Y6K2_9ZZZZ